MIHAPQYSLQPYLHSAKTQKQPKCPSADEWIRRCGTYIYDGILLSHKKNEIMPFVGTWMDLDIITVSEVNQTKINTI